MKKFLLSTLFIALFSMSVYAQLPATVHATWSPNPTSDNVTQYVIALDGGASIVVPLSACDATTCTQALTVPTFGAHVVSLFAQNQGLGGLQSGPSVSVTFTLGAAPSVVQGLRVTN